MTIEVKTPVESAFSKEQKEEILKQSQLFWDQAELVQGPFFDQVNEYERLARCLLPEELESVLAAYSDRSALVPPDVYNNLNSLMAQFRASLFRKKPFLRLHITGQHDYIDDRIKKAERILQANMDMEAKGRGFPSEAMKAFYQACYAGLTCCYTQWTRRYANTPVRGDEYAIAPGKGGEARIEHKLIAEYAETKSLDIRRCRIDPSAAEREDIRIVGYHSLAQVNDLIALNRNDAVPHYDFNETLLMDSAFDTSNYYKFVKSEAEAFDRKGVPNESFGGKSIEIQSIRGLFRFDRPDGGIDFKDLMVEIGNRKVLLAVKENTLPLHSWELFDFPAIDQQHGRLYTMGVVEPGRDTFIEQFLKHNQSLDSANYNTHATAVVDSSAGQFLPNFMESGRDQIIKLDLQASGLQRWSDAIGYLQRPVLGQDTFMHAGSLSRVLQQTMRLSDYLQGKDPDGGVETATGVATLVSGGQNLTNEMIDQLTDTYLAPTAQKKLILWNFFKADEEHQMVGRDGRVTRIEKGEIDLPFRISVQTNIAQSNPARARRFVEVYPVISNDPYFDPIEVRETLVDILELPNSERLLASTEYLEVIVDRENAALGLGAMLPVHPLDNHMMHNEGHGDYMSWAQENPDEADGLDLETVQRHMQEHDLAQQQIDAALGNTKELGGNSGSESNPTDGARAGGIDHSGGSGGALPQEGRK